MTGLRASTLLSAALSRMFDYAARLYTPRDERREKEFVRYARQVDLFIDAIEKMVDELEAKASRYDEIGQSLANPSPAIRGLENKTIELEYKASARPGICYECGDYLEQVRPGKWQCNNPKCPSNRTERKEEG